MQPKYAKALVTGGSRGIGAAISRALVAEGIEVYAIGRDADALAALASDLGALFRPITADLLDLSAIRAAIDGIEIDILVNNAGGVGTVRPLWEQTAEETARTIALNLTAPIQMMQLCLPGMIARRRGHIFNLCSTAGQGALAGTSVYGGAKAGLSQTGKGLRYDLAGHNIRLTEIAPGRVETEFYLQAFGGDAEALKQRMYTVQRPLAPQDVADALIMALRLPERADIAEITITPTDQALGGHIFPDYKP